MFGIHISNGADGTAEGWFGPGKKSVTFSITIIAILILIFAIFGILIVMNVKGETNVSINQPAPTAPVAPIAPTPIQPEPAVTNEPVPAGVIKITTEKLASELAVDSRKYDRGTVFQVSGVFQWQKEYFPAPFDFYFSIGPRITGPDGMEKLGVIIRVSVPEESEVFNAFAAIEGDREVVVQGAYSTWNNSYGMGVILQNASLISVGPAK